MADRWVDKHGDVWHEGADGLMHTAETAPFPRDHVERKWGPLRPAAVLAAPDRAQPEVDVAALLDGERWENTLDDAWPISGGRAGIVRALAGEVLDVLRDALPALLAAAEQRDALGRDGAYGCGAGWGGVVSIEDVLAAHAPLVGPISGSWCCPEPCGATSTDRDADGYPAGREKRATEHRAHVAAAIRAHLLSDEVVERAALAVATVAGLDAARDRVRAALTAATGEAP